MILSISDIHFGQKLHSTILESGLTTAEEDTQIALIVVEERARASDIDLIICAGDFSHTSKLSSENIKWIISWFKRMDALGKPFYLIPGNHDISAYSNALVFLKSLNMKNIFLIDKQISKIAWGDWSIYFVPFLISSSSKNKYTTTMEAVKTTMQQVNPDDKNIIVTHIQESSSKLGAEGMMLSRSVDVVDMDHFFDNEYKNTILLTGHMHMHQIYIKNGMTVVYPGSLTYMESTDCGQLKGYVLIDQDGAIDFEETRGIRKYKQYVLPKGKDPLDFFKSIRMSSNEVVFLTSQSDEIINDTEITGLLNERGCRLAKISYTFNKNDRESIVVSDEKKSPFSHLEEWMAKEFKEQKVDTQPILKLGKEYILNEIKCD